MIKFFRKIRQNLLLEGKTGKPGWSVGRYFKYAIGEIILVVIGILIALQINTWNEKRKAAKEEIKSLIALQADFKASKERIEGTIKSQSKVLKYSNVLAGIYERQNKVEQQFFDTHLDSLSHLIGYGTSWYREELVTGAYNSLTSAGKIDLIQNENLRNLLAQFIADFESGFEDQESSMQILHSLNTESTHFIFKITSNRIRKYYDYEPRKVDSLKVAEAFFSNDIYFGNLFLKSIDERNRLERQKQLLKQLNSIIEILEKELEQKSN